MSVNSVKQEIQSMAGEAATALQDPMVMSANTDKQEIQSMAGEAVTTLQDPMVMSANTDRQETQPISEEAATIPQGPYPSPSLSPGNLTEEGRDTTPPHDHQLPGSLTLSPQNTVVSDNGETDGELVAPKSPKAHELNHFEEKKSDSLKAYNTPKKSRQTASQELKSDSPKNYTKTNTSKRSRWAASQESGNAFPKANTKAPNTPKRFHQAASQDLLNRSPKTTDKTPNTLKRPCDEDEIFAGDGSPRRKKHCGAVKHLGSPRISPIAEVAESHRMAFESEASTIEPCQGVHTPLTRQQQQRSPPLTPPLDSQEAPASANVRNGITEKQEKIADIFENISTTSPKKRRASEVDAVKENERAGKRRAMQQSSIQEATENASTKKHKSPTKEAKKGIRRKANAKPTAKVTKKPSSNTAAPENKNLVDSDAKKEGAGKRKRNTDTEEDAGDDAAPPVKRIKAGLKNMSNTCYLNSCLQALLSTEPFRKFFLERIGSASQEERMASRNRKRMGNAPAGRSSRRQGKTRKEEPKRSLLSELTDLFDCLYNNSSGESTSNGSPSSSKKKTQSLAYSAHEFQRAVAEEMPDFESPNKQQDAHEFLITLLNNIQYDLAEQGKFDSDNVVSSVFRGEYLVEDTCNDCGHKSPRKDPFMDLSLRIPSTDNKKEVTLDACLKEHVSVENICVTCDNCNSKFAIKSRSTTINQSPEVLVLQLQRYEWNKARTFANKIHTKVDIPQQMDLSLYMSPEARKAEENHNYELYSAIDHLGRNPCAGHYINKSKVDGTWTLFNDQSVSDIAPENVEFDSSYVLFYKKMKD